MVNNAGDLALVQKQTPIRDTINDVLGKETVEHIRSLKGRDIYPPECQDKVNERLLKGSRKNHHSRINLHQLSLSVIPDLRFEGQPYGYPRHLRKPTSTHPDGPDSPWPKLSKLASTSQPDQHKDKQAIRYRDLWIDRGPRSRNHK